MLIASAAQLRDIVAAVCQDRMNLFGLPRISGMQAPLRDPEFTIARGHAPHETS